MRVGHNLRGIAFAPRRDLDLEIDASHALDGIDHLQHRKAMTVAAIGGQRRPAAAQMAQRIGMCAGKIADVNIVANAGAVRRRIVGAEDVEFGAQAERCFDRDLDQMRRRLGRLTGAAEWIGTGDVEVTQNDMIESVRAAGVARPGRRKLVSYCSTPRKKRRTATTIGHGTTSTN